MRISKQKAFTQNWTIGRGFYGKIAEPFFLEIKLFISWVEVRKMPIFVQRVRLSV